MSNRFTYYRIAVVGILTALIAGTALILWLSGKKEPPKANANVSAANWKIHKGKN